MRIVRSRDKYFERVRRNVGRLDEVCHEAIQKIRQDPTVATRKDMLANFLNSKQSDQLDDNTLRDILLNLTIAGRDTTGSLTIRNSGFFGKKLSVLLILACALTWMFYILTQNPEVQRRVQAEIDEKLGDKDPEFSDLSPENMPYLNGVLYETLRLHPPVRIRVRHYLLSLRRIVL